MVNCILDSGPYDADNIREKVITGIAHIIKRILKHSPHAPYIVMAPDVIITPENCPAKYTELYRLLVGLQKGEVPRDNLYVIIERITQLPSFKELDPSRFLLEMAGLIESPRQTVHYDDTNITADLIRDTFYNEMVTQGLLAVENQWLTKDDIDDQESQIYFVLPALTILEALRQSISTNGIRLLNEKILTNNNCPILIVYASSQEFLFQLKISFKI